MISTSELLLIILRTNLLSDRRDTISPISIPNEVWKSLYQLSSRQGVLSIVWDSIRQLASEQVLSAKQMPDKQLRLQWALSAERIKKRFRKQSALAKELADIYSAKGIKTIVLKGLAVSGYYPVPEHREYGDLDCFLVKTGNSRQGATLATNTEGRPVLCYDDGNQMAKDAGADVEIGYYKHSHINYKGLTVENHAFCTAVRGSRDRKALERYLQTLIVAKPLTRIGDSHLFRPCADFNALLLTAHSFGHFLTEGIKLRSVLDWAFFLKAEQDNINWKSFYAWCDMMHYTKFVDALTAISAKHLGLTITNKEIHRHSDLADKVLDDIMNSDCSIFNTGVSKCKMRLMIVRNRVFGSWKYRELYDKSAVLDTMQMVWAFFVERKPKI